MGRVNEADSVAEYFDSVPEGEEYVSESTIDNEPREPDGTEGQTEMFARADDDAKDALSFERPSRFEVQLKLSLKAVDGNKDPHVLPIVHAEIRRDRIEEMIAKHVTSAYFIERLRAVVGDPVGTIEVETDSDDMGGDEQGADHEGTTPQKGA